MSITTNKFADVDGLDIFYREAGPKDAPVILLLHGYPSSSHMFRDLIPKLANDFHLIAPDLPGFGQSAMPSRKNFEYTFENFSKIIHRFTEIIGLEKFAIYIFDYGAPTGLRIAISDPKKITAIITQNGNAYLEGLSDGWNPTQRYWQDPSIENREAIRNLLTPETTKWQYTEGVRDLSKISPDGYSLDNYYLARPDAGEIQLDIFLNYASNVVLYPEFQRYFREHQPPLLAIWGDKDPFFLPEGALAYKRDIHNAKIKFLDTGHFALETHSSEIAQEIISFLKEGKF